MPKPELLFVVGCNAAGKSTFIRTRLDQLSGYKILMTDVYKSRTKNLAEFYIAEGRNIILETVFNDASFMDLVNFAQKAGYKTSLIVLFLDNVSQSVARVAMRVLQQNGIPISDGNVKLNFVESFKNVADYFYHFDRVDFIYTGEGSGNQLIMNFHRDTILSYAGNQLVYPQKFAAYSFHRNHLNEEVRDLIIRNVNFKSDFLS